MGSVTELEAGADPFILDYRSGDERPWLGIRASSCRITYFNNGSHPLSTFVSNEDDKFKVEVYRAGTDLVWTGFIVQADSSEAFRPTPYAVSLEATDNLGLLKEAFFEDGDLAPSIYYKHELFTLFYKIFIKTGLQIPFNTYCNIYEAAMANRSTILVADPFIQAKIDTRTFLENEDKFNDCYTILDKILNAWNCSLFQAEGEWQIIRWLDAKDFNNHIPGTRYPENFVITPEAVTLGDVKNIGLDEQLEPINAGHIKSLIMPSKKVELTFNYEMPERLITNIDFTILGDLLSTSTSGDIRTDNYQTENWIYVNPPATGTYIVVKTNIITGVEVDRYVVIPFNASFSSYLQSNTFEVNAGDRFDCSLRFRANTDTGDNIIFRFGFYLLGISGTHWSLTEVSGNLQWNDISASTTANSIDQTVSNSTDITEWQSIDIFEGTTLEYIPVIPEDGTLELQIKAFNDTNVSQPARDAFIKDITFNYIYYISNSTLITGHQHTSVQTPKPKKDYEEIIYLDDAPKNSVKGVMFLSSGFKTETWYRGSMTGSIVVNIQTLLVGNIILFANQRAEIGSRFYVGQQITLSGSVSNNTTFTVLAVYSSGINNLSIAVLPGITAETTNNVTITFVTKETLKFGHIQKLDLMFLNDKTRDRIEGEFFGLEDTAGPVSLLNVFTIATLTGKYFIMGPVSFNYMKATWSGVLEELWNEDETFNPNLYTNTFKYIYK